MMISIDLTDRRPIYEQLKENVIRLAMLGVLAPDEQLPSVRTLAKQLAVNPNTVQKAYQDLEHEGFIYSAPGRGSFISAGMSESKQLKEEARESLQKACIQCRLVNIKKDEAAEILSAAYQEKLEK